MLTKIKSKERIKDFPEESSLDDTIERLLLIDKIERGSRQSEKGQTFSETGVDKEIEKLF